MTGADGLPIALVSWALVWLLVWRGISLTARSVIAVEAVSLLLIVFKLPRGTGLAAVGFARTYGIL